VLSNHHSTVDGSVRPNEQSSFRLNISEGVGSGGTSGCADKGSLRCLLDVTDPGIVLQESGLKLSSSTGLHSQVSSESKHASGWHLELKQLSSISLFRRIQQDSLTIIQVIYNG